MSLYNFDAARSQDQLEDMQDLNRRGICIFCPEYIHQDARSIEFETNHWMVKPNSYPYKNSKLHLLLIPKIHVKTISELPSEVQKNFLQVVSQCEVKFNLDSYAIGMRSGDMRYNGSSIEHLHAHIVVGDADQKEFEPVRFKMSSRPKD